MIKLNLPYYEFRIRENNGAQEIFDELRRKYVVLTPEEWVRQNLLQYLIREKGYPASLIVLEKPVKIGSMQQRADFVVHHPDGKPLVIAECKAPGVKINQKVFDQIAVYNLHLKVPFLLVTNGLNHYCCEMDLLQKKYNFFESIPAYSEIKNDLD